MKQCPVCKSTYTDDSLSFCLNDGANLIAPSFSSQITQEMNFNSDPTLANNQPIRVSIPQNNPTHFSVPQNTTQTQQKNGSSPVLLATISVLLIAILGGCAAIAYFAFIKPSNGTNVNTIIANTSPTPATNTTITKNETPDETQALKDKLEKLEKQLNDQKNAKNTSPAPASTMTPIQQSPVPARVSSPGDGFLALRTSPSIQTGTQISQIPHGSTVNVLGCQGYTKIGDKTGRWCRVNYSGQQGWAFDAFLIY